MAWFPLVRRCLHWTKLYIDLSLAFFESFIAVCHFFLSMALKAAFAILKSLFDNIFGLQNQRGDDKTVHSFNNFKHIYEDWYQGLASLQTSMNIA